MNDQIPAAREKARKLPQIQIKESTLADIEMIAIGGFSPLTGFLNQADYKSVLKTCRLVDGTIWPIPIVLSVNAVTKKNLQPGQSAALVFNGEIIAVIHVDDVYAVDKKEEARQVYQTTDDKHPGVAAVFAQDDFYVGGKIDVFAVPPHSEFAKYNLTPSEMRRAFQEKGWKTVVGFQTRNPIHRAHEYITKVALETVDGLLIHPLVGKTKQDDIPATVRMACYEALLQNYYPADRVLLAINPGNMYYAGPREALLHMLVRKNYGCTHFIVGRDHAGVGNYYGTYEAQDFIRGFDSAELGIQPLFFENSFWSKKNGGMATAKTSANIPEDQINLSGSQVRDMLKAGQLPPPEIMRPEVAQVLRDWMR